MIFTVYGKRKFSYLTGVTTIKVNAYGNWVHKDSSVFARKLTHVFVAHPIDNNHYFVSFFTSPSETKIGPPGNFETIGNMPCSSSILRHINRPVIMHKDWMCAYLNMQNSVNALAQALKIPLQQKEQLRSLLNDIIYNFKTAFYLKPDEKVVKIIDVTETNNRLHLKVKTRTDIMVGDDTSTIFTDRMVEVPLYRKGLFDEIDIKTFLNENTHIINTDEEAMVLGINQLLDYLNIV